MRALGEVEGLAVPVQHGRVRGEGEAWRGALLALVALFRAAGGDLEPADLLCRVAIDACAVRAGDQLCAQADAEHRPAARDHVRDEALLRDQPGEFRLVIDAHRPAHHHEQLDRGRVGQRRRFPQAGRADVRAARGEPVADVARAFEGDMLQDVGFHGVLGQ